MASCACVSYSPLLNPFSSDAGRHKRRPLLSQSDPSRSFAEKDPAWVICFSFFGHHNRPRSISSRLPFPLFAPQLSAPFNVSSFQMYFFPPKLLPCEQKVSQNFRISPLAQPLRCHIKIKLYPGEASCLTVGRGGGWWRLGQYLLFWRCAPPSRPTTTGWSSGWVGGLWCCTPGWPPRKHTSAPRICPGS